MLDAQVSKWLLLLGAFMGFLSVVLGSFGAHALKQRIEVDMLSVFEVGVRYQMYHALAIFAAVWISTVMPNAFSGIAGWLFVAGSLIFSGSLYALALTGIRVIGAVTPIGGFILLAGWLCMIIGIYRGAS